MDSTIETEQIDRLFLELSQFTKAKTAKELALEAERRELEKALRGLVQANESWNEVIQKHVGRPPMWNDSYLDQAREVLAKIDKENEHG